MQDRPQIHGERRLLTYRQVIDNYLPVSKSKIYHLIRAGELLKVNIGVRGYVTSDSVHAFMNRLEGQANS